MSWKSTDMLVTPRSRNVRSHVSCRQPIVPENDYSIFPLPESALTTLYQKLVFQLQHVLQNHSFEIIMIRILLSQ